MLVRLVRLLVASAGHLCDVLVVEQCITNMPAWPLQDIKFFSWSHDSLG